MFPVALKSQSSTTKSTPFRNPQRWQAVSLRGYSGHVERSITLNVRLLQPRPKERTPSNIWNFYSKNNFKIQTCLFTIARFSASESLRVYPNIYKNSPPFASRKGFPLVGFAMSEWERESASDSIIIITIYKRIRGEEGGTCE